jgi:hypothetical protein
MKRLTVTLLLFLLGAAGCQKPSDVIVDPPDSGQELVVSSVVEADTTLQTASDSTGLVGKDRNRFAGSILLTSVKYDKGFGVVTVSAATAVLEDRSRPILAASTAGKVVGYWGLFLGNSLRLNGATMVPMARKLAGISAGWKYVDVTFTYRPNHPYRIVSPADTVGAIGDSVDSPDDLSVLSPIGGGVFSRIHDLEMRWKGTGTIAIIIQSYERNTGKTRPLLLVTPKINRGHAILDTKILALLPRGKEFVFTFVLANRHELSVPRYDGTVLFQAASIYNSYVVIN